MSTIFGLLLLFTVGSAWAVVEAPAVAYDFQQNPSNLEWKHIVTENFDIIFPENIEAEAQRVAHLLEKSYPFVTRSLEIKPSKIPIVLQNQSTNSNGFVTLAPRRSEWFVTPAIDPELSNTEWLKTLAIHEFRHVAQFQKTRRGFNRAYEIILGEIGQALGLGLTVPPWFLEGDAVGMETALTRGGRGRLPLFERDLRALLLSGKDWGYDKAHLGSYDDYIPSHYVYGYFYTSWLRNTYGDLFLSRLVNESADHTWNPLSFYNAVKTLTGKDFDKLYREIIGDLIKEWKLRADRLTPTPYEVKTLGKRFGWTNYEFPQVTNDGKIVALKNGLSFINQFVLIDGTEERTILYPGPLQNKYPFKVRGGKLAYFEAQFDPRWGLRDYSKLQVYDLNQDRFVLTKPNTKGRLAVPDNAGERVIYVEWGEDQRQFIVAVDLKGKILHRVSYTGNKVITSLDWLGPEEVVFVSKDREDTKSIKKLDLATGKETVLLEAGHLNVGFLTVEEGHVLFESPESGIDNIWMLTKKGPRQITSSPYGAYAPTLSQGRLIYNDYTAMGMNVVEKSLDWKSEESSKDSFYPIFEKFSKSEKLEDFEVSLGEETIFKTQRYSQTENSINPHSWILLAPPLSPNVALTALSRDTLNNLTLTAGGIYNQNENTLEGFVGAAFTHYYPVFDLRAAYGNRNQDILTRDGRKIDNEWEEGTLSAGVSVPWRFIQGRFTHTFTARAFTELIKVTNKLPLDRSEVNDGLLLSPGVEFSYGVVARSSQRDLNPPLGLIIDAVTEEGRDITGDDQRGRLVSFDGRFYFPGIGRHHSFYHQLAYEKQDDKFYQYESQVLYPRGTRTFFLEEFRKYSANYLMPLFYPDQGISPYLYFKRISLNLFYDELNGRLLNAPYKAASLGWEGLFEMNFVRIFIPFTIGVRGSYVLQGLEKEQNYELFLATVLGTF